MSEANSLQAPRTLQPEINRFAEKKKYRVNRMWEKVWFIKY